MVDAACKRKELASHLNFRKEAGKQLEPRHEARHLGIVRVPPLRPDEEQMVDNSTVRHRLILGTRRPPWWHDLLRLSGPDDARVHLPSSPYEHSAMR
jgi:hypothetical protein